MCIFNRFCTFVLVAVLSLAGISFSQEPEAFKSERDILIEQCTSQKMSVPRTFGFRDNLQIRKLRRGAHGAGSWWNSVRKIVPFVPSDRAQYERSTFKTLNEVFNLPIPVGESKRSKKIRAENDKFLSTLSTKGEKQWEDWIVKNPDATEDEKSRAEIVIRFQGAKTAELSQFNWRDQGIDVGEVFFQDFECNTCWAFSTVDAMQISRRILAMRLQTPLSLPNQTPSAGLLEDCMILDVKKRCKDNWHGNAFTFMVDSGLPLFDPSKEESGAGTCSKDAEIKALTWDFVSNTPQKVAGTADIKRAIVTYGPVVSMISYDSCLWLYKDGVFNEEQFEDGSHLLLIIGWDDEKGAWLVKNSYGVKWGEDGFGWIKYGANNIGQWAAWIMPDPNEETKAAKGQPISR